MDAGEFPCSVGGNQQMPTVITLCHISVQVKDLEKTIIISYLAVVNNEFLKLEGLCDAALS